MSNETTPPQGETPNGTSPQGETPNVPQGETPESTAPQLSSDDIAKELERLKVALKRANSDAKEHRLKAEELDRLKADIEATKLSETEKLQRQLADATKARDDALRAQQELRVSNAVTLAAGRLNFNDPDDGMRYIKTADLDDDLSNVGDLLKQVLKERPYLAAVGKGQTVPTSGGATNPSRSQSAAPQALSWDTISKLTPPEYEARRGEIQAWILAHPPGYGQRMR